jgi:hypothetical protein
MEKTEGPEGTKGFLYGKYGRKLSHYEEIKNLMSPYLENSFQQVAKL